MKDWLVKRLTPQKVTEERWISLSRVLQELWEFFFDPALSRLERLRSYYQADEADLDRKLREMGDYFQADFSRFEDKPIAVSWRNLELKYKDLELILTSTFRRHYKNLPVEWYPLFAPVDRPYGSLFLPLPKLPALPSEKNIPPEGMFLTSRGMLGADRTALLELGMSREQFLARAIPLLKRTKPLHIVFDGPLFYIFHPIPFECDTSLSSDAERSFFVPFSVRGLCFDITAADTQSLDLDTLSFSREKKLFYSLSWKMDRQSHLDKCACFDDCAADLFCLDMPIGDSYV